LDEAPQAYKDIGTVMQSQRQLIDVLGKFIPRIVKMDGAAPKQWRKPKNEGNILEGE
jgi:tRNA-splicing ligase RtcB